MKRIPINVLFIALTIIGCDSRKSIPVADKTLHINTEPRTENLSTIFETSVDYIPLELTQENQIGFIGQVIWHDDRIYILDNSEANALFVFNEEGKFLFQIGRQGLGPGEYLSPRYFQISSENNIYLYDSRSIKIIIYSQNGNLIKEIQMDEKIYAFTLLEDETIVLDRGNKKSQSDFMLHMIDIEGNLKSKSIEIPENLTNKTTGTSHMFSQLDSGIAYIPSFSPVIYHQKGNEMIPYYNLDFGSKNFDEDDFETELQGNWLMPFFEKGNPLFPEIFETEDYIHLTFRVGNLRDGHKTVYFHNKSNGSEISFSNFIDDIGISQLNIVGIVNDEILINSVDANLIEKEIIENNNLPILSSDDNPVLMKVRIKNF